jgi:hypothetical protein
MTLDSMIQRYVALRDKKEAIQEKHKTELAPVNEFLSQLEAHMLEAMNQQGLQNVKSPHGTAFKVTRTSATVSDWEQFLAYVRNNEAWDLLERRVAKLAAQAVIEETQTPIPGVETSSEVCVNVRRPTAKSVAGK